MGRGNGGQGCLGVPAGDPDGEISQRQEGEPREGAQEPRVWQKGLLTERGGSSLGHLEG